jgi:hypothetical protein
MLGLAAFALRLKFGDHQGDASMEGFYNTRFG